MQPKYPNVHRIGRTGRAGKSGRSVTFVSYNEMGYLRAIEKLTKKEMKAMRPPTKEDAYQASLSVAMDEIKRDLQEEKLKSKLAKFDADAEQLMADYDVKELVAMLIQSRVKDPDTMPEVQITAERPLPFNGENKGFKGKSKGGKGSGRYGRERSGKGGYRGKADDKKRNWRNRDDKKREYYKKDRKPKTQGSEKQTGFVMRNRGDK